MLTIDEELPTRVRVAVCNLGDSATAVMHRAPVNSSIALALLPSPRCPWKRIHSCFGLLACIIGSSDLHQYKGEAQ
jgi:hypothetical protein